MNGDSKVTYAESGFKSQLPPFLKTTMENCIEDTNVLEVYPIAPLENSGPIQFVVPPSERYYLDMYNSCIKLSFKITLADGSETKPWAKSKTPGTDESAVEMVQKIEEQAPIPLNNFAHSMFSRCQLELNGTCVGADHSVYPFIAYIMNTLNLSSNAKTSQINTQAMYVSDFVSGTVRTTPVKVSQSQNSRLAIRAQLVENSREGHLYMKPFVDMFQQSEYLLNNVELRLTMFRSSPEFALMCLEDPSTQTYKIKITSATLELRRIVLLDQTARAYESALACGIKATYFFPTLDARHFEIAQGQHNYTAMNVFSGPVPQRAYFFLIPSEAFLGNLNTNPLIFWHYYVSQVNFMLDNQPIRAKPIVTNFDESNKDGMNYLNAYKSLFEVCRTIHTNIEMDINYSTYAKKMCIFGLDVAGAQSYNSPSKRGSFSIDIRFAKPTPMPLKGICIGEFKNQCIIDSYRNVENIIS